MHLLHDTGVRVFTVKDCKWKRVCTFSMEERMFRLTKEWQKRAGMAAAVFFTLAAGMLLFYRHWQFELPFYPNVDEQLSLDCIYDLLNQHLYAGDIYVLDFFRYPHFTFYYAVLGVRILSRFISGVDTVILIRYVVCGTALLSNVLIYFVVKMMTGSRRWAYIGLVLSIFSLYGYAYLYYTGPDTMIYAVANVILFLGCLIYKDTQADRVVYLWYPLIAICIGLATAAKYHGILFGIFWLALHISKQYWKSYRNNFLFFLNCILIVLVFCLCNYSMFFNFRTFVGDNMYNFKHYAWGHPGIEHNLPLLGYLEAYGLTSYGVVGGILLMLGIWRLAHRKDWRQIGVFVVMPLFIILFLSRYQIMLGRNLSLVVPFAYLFMVYGMLETVHLLERILASKKVWDIGVTVALLVLMVGFNVVMVCNGYRYDLTYTEAEHYIESQIPENATVYCTSFAPNIDEQRYMVIDIGEDISQLPETLGEGEYFVDVEYATGYFRQPKDYLIREGEDMYPDLRIAHEEKTGAYPLKQSYAGISYGKEWKYRIGYMDILKYDPEEYYVGPTVMIYGE